MILLRNVSRKYGDFNALNDVSADLKGNFVIITGKSGSGKSTLLNLLGTIDNGYEGNIELNSVELKGLSEKEKCEYRNKKIGFIYQQFNLEPNFSVYANVELPLLIGKVKKEERSKLVKEALGLVGLRDKEKQKARTLSGGEKQRVAIARAIVNNPVVVLADEPTGNLDEENSKIVLDKLKEISNSGKQVIMVTHNLDDLKYANQIIMLRDGRVEKNELC